MKKFSLEFFTKTRWVFVLVKNNKIIYRSKKQGLAPLIFCLKNRPKELAGAHAYDKVIGRAAVLLLIHGKAKRVMTPLITKNALKLLEKNKIKVEYGKTAQKILNKKGDDLCPMEKLSAGKGAKEFAEILMKK